MQACSFEIVFLQVVGAGDAAVQVVFNAAAATTLTLDMLGSQLLQIIESFD